MIVRRELSPETLKGVGEAIWEELKLIEGAKHHPSGYVYSGIMRCESFRIRRSQKRELFLEQSINGSIPLRLGIYLEDAPSLARHAKAATIQILESHAESLRTAGFVFTHSVPDCPLRRDYKIFDWEKNSTLDWLTTEDEAVFGSKPLGRDIVKTFNISEVCHAEIIRLVKLLVPLWIGLNGLRKRFDN